MKTQRNLEINGKKYKMWPFFMHIKQSFDWYYLCFQSFADTNRETQKQMNSLLCSLKFHLKVLILITAQNCQEIIHLTITNTQTTTKTKCLIYFFLKGYWEVFLLILINFINLILINFINVIYISIKIYKLKLKNHIV